MPKISELPPEPNIEPDDEIPFLNKSAGTTNRGTVEDLADSDAFTSKYMQSEGVSNVFIQSATPVTGYNQYVWFQLLGGSDMTIWVEDGL